MRKIFFALMACSFIACNDNSTSATNGEAKPNVPTNMYGFTPNYSASFVMDPADNSETVLALWNEWKDGDLSKSRPHFADSLTLFMADGTNMNGLTDDVLKNVQEYRNQFTNMEANIDAIFAVKSTDKDEHWVAVWGVEMPTDANGKKDTVSLQETWRFNKAGKVDLMFQSVRKGMIPPPPAQ